MKPKFVWRGLVTIIMPSRAAAGQVAVRQMWFYGVAFKGAMIGVWRFPKEPKKRPTHMAEKVTELIKSEPPPPDPDRSDPGKVGQMA